MGVDELLPSEGSCWVTDGAGDEAGGADWLLVLGELLLFPVLLGCEPWLGALVPVFGFCEVWFVANVFAGLGWSCT